MSLKKAILLGLAVFAVICHCQAEEEAAAAEEEKEKVDYNKMEGVYFYESFDKDLSRWTLSKDPKYTGNTNADVKLEAQDDDISEDLSLTLESGARFYGLSAALNKVFDIAKSTKPFVVQYEVRMKQPHSCGGAYLKLLSQNDSNTDDDLTDKTPFSIMFGPDKCGDNNKVHFIARHQSPVTGFFEEKALTEPPKMKLDEQTSHLYTLIVKPDSKFELYIDGKKETSGHLLDSMTPPVIPPKEIDDPDDVKPADWVDEEEIPDPDAKKPEDWDEDAPEYIIDPEAKKPEDWDENAPEYIPDPDAKKPEDWDDDMDGEWTAPEVPNPVCEESGCGKWAPPTIPNPAYKGKWSAPYIKNPAYKGPFIPRRIPNPAYFEDKNPVEHIAPIRAVAIEIWTMTPQTTFDNILVADSKEVADKVAKETWKARFDAQEVLRKAEAAKKNPADSDAEPSFVERFMENWGDYLNELVELTHEKPEISIAVAAVVAIMFPVLIWITCSSGKPEKEEEKKEVKKEEEKEEVKEVKEEEEEVKEVKEEKKKPAKEVTPPKKVSTPKKSPKKPKKKID